MIMRTNLYNEDDRQYLQMMQENIARMAGNSSNCKTWMITIVAGILAIGCKVDELNGWIIFAIVPIVTFWYLDTFYLRLERGMRNRQRNFLNEISNYSETDYKKELYEFRPLTKEKDDSEKGLVSTKWIAVTKSILPFYLSLLLVVFLFIVKLNSVWIHEKLNVIVDSVNSLFDKI